MRIFRAIRYLVLLPLLSALAHAQTSNGYTQTNLVSDGSVKAQQTDTTLINPWGVAIGQQTPFWINTAGTGQSEVYDSGSNKQFIVKIPAAGGSPKTGSPTGIAFNSSTTDFVLSNGSPALFIFDALDGTISAWNLDLPPFLRQAVKTQNPMNGELSHGFVTQAVHQGIQAGRGSAAGSRGITGRGCTGAGGQPERVATLAA